MKSIITVGIQHDGLEAVVLLFSVTQSSGFFFLNIEDVLVSWLAVMSSLVSLFLHSRPEICLLGLDFGNNTSMC